LNDLSPDPESNGEVLIYSEKRKLKAAQAHTVCYRVVEYPVQVLNLWGQK
jgi:hypothetical protein